MGVTLLAGGVFVLWGRGERAPRRRRRTRWWWIVAAAIVAVVVVCAVATAGLLGRAVGTGLTALWGSECVVEVAGEQVGVDRQQAMAATTAAALQARGEEPPADVEVDPQLVDALLTGPADGPGPVLTCFSGSTTELAAEEMGPSGLTPRAETLLAEMTDVHGELSLGGFEPGGVRDGHGADSTHYREEAIDVFFRPVSEEQRHAGWLLAQWLVAHAQRLEVSVVIFDDQIWSAQFALAGWRPYVSSDTSNDILQHRDHVHVDVRRGQ